MPTPQTIPAIPPDDALILATKRCDRGRVRLLLDQGGADVNATDKIGWTPLMWAVKRGDAGMARVLLVHGADAWFVDNWGATPFDLAHGERRMDLMALLVSASRQRPPNPVATARLKVA